MHRQLERYRRLGRGTRLIEHSRRHLSIELREDADVHLVAETAAIEGECCPCFDVSWDGAARPRSSISSFPRGRNAARLAPIDVAGTAPPNRISCGRFAAPENRSKWSNTPRAGTALKAGVEGVYSESPAIRIPSTRSRYTRQRQILSP